MQRAISVHFRNSMNQFNTTENAAVANIGMSLLSSAAEKDQGNLQRLIRIKDNVE